MALKYITKVSKFSFSTTTIPKSVVFTKEEIDELFKPEYKDRIEKDYNAKQAGQDKGFTDSIKNTLGSKKKKPNIDDLQFDKKLKKKIVEE